MSDNRGERPASAKPATDAQTTPIAMFRIDIGKIGDRGDRPDGRQRDIAVAAPGGGAHAMGPIVGRIVAPRPAAG